MLKCQHCGTNKNGKGETFKSDRGLKAHERFCNKNPNKNNKNVSRETLSDVCEKCGGTFEPIEVMIKRHRNNVNLNSKMLYAKNEMNVKQICSKCFEMRG